MKNITHILFALSLVLLLSCDNFTGEIRKIEQPDFEISLPDWIEETTDLAPHAHYQFKSRYRNTIYERANPGLVDSTELDLN